MPIAVVRCQHDDRVVELPRLFQVIKQPAELRVGVIQESCERFEQTAGEALLVLRQVTPLLYARIAICQEGVGRNQAARELPFVPFLAYFIPTSIKSSAVLFDIIGGRLMRFMHCTQREVHEEWLLWPVRPLVAQE